MKLELTAECKRIYVCMHKQWTKIRKKVQFKEAKTV